MKRLILANTSVTEQQLRALARERALAVMNFLLSDGKLPQDRLFEKSTDPFASPEKERPAGGWVEFGVVARYCHPGQFSGIRLTMKLCLLY